MGFSDLVLVNPRDPDVVRHDEAIALASGAADILAAARVVSSLDEALSACNFSVALSARPREFSPPLYEPRQLAEQLAADTTLRTALVFGSERYGLSNEQVSKCSALVSVPANPAYSSLNLAQAVQVIAYECRVAALGEVRSENATGFRGQRASAEQIEGMFAHLEKALVEIEFLDADNPKKLMPRLRRLFARAELEVEEVNILRGVATQLISKRQRIRKE
jgi:tRNA/rRNA methyltransferase